MASIGFLTVMAAAALPVLFLIGRFRRATGSAPNPVFYLAALLPGVFFLSFLGTTHQDGMFLLYMLLVIVLVGFATLWVREVVHLMGLGDGAFPGRHDKLMWFLLLVCLPPIGTIAFGIFRRAYWPISKPARDTIAHDLA